MVRPENLFKREMMARHCPSEEVYWNHFCNGSCQLGYLLAPVQDVSFFFDQQQKNRDNMDPLVFWQNVAQFKAWEGIWVCPHLSSNHSNASVFVWTPQSRAQVWTSTQIQTLVEGETTWICQAWEQMSMNYRKPGLILIPQSFKDSDGGYLTKIYLIKDLKIGSDEQVECTAKKNGYFSFHVHLGMKRYCG